MSEDDSAPSFGFSGPELHKRHLSAETVPWPSFAWIVLGRFCHYRTWGIAEWFSVSELQLKAWFDIIVPGRPLERWIHESTACDAMCLLVGGYSCSQTASALGFHTTEEFSSRFEKYHGIAPDNYPPEYERVFRFEARYLREKFGPEFGEPEPGWMRGFRILTRSLPVEPPEVFPSRSLLVHSLHRLVCANDEAARALMTEILWDGLRQKLSRKFPDAGIALVWDACDDAITFYLRNPAKFVRARGELEAWLYRIACRKLAQMRAAVSRHTATEIPHGTSAGLDGISQSSASAATPKIPQMLQHDYQLLKSTLHAVPMQSDPQSDPTTRRIAEFMIQHLTKYWELPSVNEIEKATGIYHCAVQQARALILERWKSALRQLGFK